MNKSVKLLVCTRLTIQFSLTSNQKSKIQIKNQVIKNNITEQYRIQHVNYHTPVNTENREGEKRALSNNNSHLNRSICSGALRRVARSDIEYG